MGDFFSGLIDGISSGDFLSSALQVGAGLFGGLQKNKIDQQAQEAAAQAQKNAQIFALQKELLGLNYKGLGGGGGRGGGGRGGGGGGAAVPLMTTAEKVAAKQNSNKANMDALASLIAAYQNSFK